MQSGRSSSQTTNLSNAAAAWVPAHYFWGALLTDAFSVRCGHSWLMIVQYCMLITDSQFQ